MKDPIILPGRLYGDTTMIVFVLGVVKKRGYDDTWKVITLRWFRAEAPNAEIVRYCVDRTALSQRWWVECHQI